jgi:hypothetical protein
LYYPRLTRNRAAFVAMAALFLALQPSPAAAQRERVDCSKNSIGLTPLTEMNGATYMGAEGGLYPGGSNSLPADHLALGMTLMELVRPLNTEGQPAEGGSIGFVGVGVSTTHRIWDSFTALVRAESDINPRVVLVNSGFSGHPIGRWMEPEESAWIYLEDQVAAAGLSPAQVQVAWVMMPDLPMPPPPFPERQEDYREQLQAVLRKLKANYPNLQLAYLSSHQYAGYGIQDIVEPGSGYEHGFGVKWTIESQINGEGNINADPAQGPIMAPWIAWGPYTWADGVIPRADGLIWECDDFGSDGSHPREQGSLKLATLLMEFLASDPTTTPWFLGEGVEPQTTTTTVGTPTTTTQATTTTPDPTTSTATSAGLPETESGNNGSSTPWLLIVSGGVAIAIIAIGAAAALRNRPDGRK